MGKAGKAGAKKTGYKATDFLGNMRFGWDLESYRLGSFLSGPEAEDALAMESFRRGADVAGALKVVSLRRDTLRRSRMPHDLRGMGMDLSPLSGRLEFDPPFDPFPIWEEYRRTMRAEWERIPGWVQASFDFDGAAKKAFAGVSADERRFTFYLRSRPLYYQAGYSQPVDQIFLKLTTPGFLGREVGGGVSECFAEALSQAEKLLIRWDSPLSKASSVDIQKVYGFVPRFIAGSIKLSNHAFGLAIDVDAPNNPHLKMGEKGPSGTVFDVIKKITGYDFGHSFVDRSLPPPDRARYIHQQQREASEKLKLWLQAHLPEYISMARAQSTGHKPGDPLFKDDEFSTGGPPQSTVEAVDCKALVTGYSLEGVKTWARGGIQTVPVELAAALLEVGMRWGSEYEGSKDVMHFEQDPAWKYLTRDSKPRPLTDLVLPGQHTNFQLVSDEEWVRGHW